MSLYHTIDAQHQKQGSIHQIYAQTFSQILLSKTVYFRHADEISIGDEVLVYNKDQVKPEKVVSISNIKMQGKKLTDFWKLE